MTARLSMATELFDESRALAVLTEIVVALPGYDNVRDPVSEQALSGFVRSSVPDLGAFRYAIPDLEPVGGSVEVDVTLAGTLAEVGQGRRPPDWVLDVLAARDRGEGGRTAPARGLCLVAVQYDEGPPPWVGAGPSKQR